MEYTILVRCFFVGILASSSLGPIFVLTFNRGAVYGFSRGFATALGSCIADGFYFFLGMLGVLAVLKESKYFMFLLDTVGGILLILLGIYFLKKTQKNIRPVYSEHKLGIWFLVSKSFLLTVINPMVLLFFMFIGVQILPEGVETLSLKNVILGSIMVVLGSLTVLSAVALMASHVGRCISEKWLKRVSFITGLIFIGVGIYFLDHLVLGIIRLYKS